MACHILCSRYGIQVWQHLKRSIGPLLQADVTIAVESDVNFQQKKQTLTKVYPKLQIYHLNHRINTICLLLLTQKSFRSYRLEFGEYICKYSDYMSLKLIAIIRIRRLLTTQNIHV